MLKCENAARDNMHEDPSQLKFSDDQFVKISYGMFLTIVGGLATVFIWVGSIQYSLANGERMANDGVEKITEVEKFMHHIDVKLAKIEGILEELRKK